MNHPSDDRFWDDGDDDGDDDDGEDRASPSGPLPKPDELLRLHSATSELFEILKGWFEIDDRVALDLSEIDSAVAELGDPQMVIALAMRKLQALHLLATPGIRTATDVVVAIVNDLERAMVQASNMWLKRRAAATDWDDELAAFTEALADGPSPAAVPGGDDPDAPTDPAGAADPDAGVDAIDRFRYLHSQLHDAMFAVIETSEGEIRELE